MYTKQQINKIAKGMFESLTKARVADSCCLDCIHFKEREGELCSLVNARPPARVIVNGCERFEDIPF